MQYQIKSVVILFSILCLVNIDGACVTAQEDEGDTRRPVTVAVITFQTLPEDIQDNQWLGTGISEDLSDRLEAAEFESLSVYERRDSTKITRKVAGAQGIINPNNSAHVMSLKQDVRTRGVDYLILGSIQSPGKWDNSESEFTLNANIVTVNQETDSGEVADAISVSGKFGSGGVGLFFAQTELSVKIVEALGIESVDFKGTPLSRGQTSSLQAFKSYSEAMIAFDNEDYETAKASFFKAYQTTGGSYHSALPMFEKSDELRIEALESQGAKGTDITSEIAAGDKLLEELEAKQEQHLATIKFVRAQRAVWKQKRYLDDGDREKADAQGHKAIKFLEQFGKLNRNKALLWRFRAETEIELVSQQDNVIIIATQKKLESEYDLVESLGREMGNEAYIQAIIGISPVSGKQMWRIETDMFYNIGNPDVIGDVLLFSADGTLYAYDTETGQKKWKYSSDYDMSSTIASAYDDTFVLFSLKNTSQDIIKFPALDIRTGKVIYEQDLSDDIKAFKSLHVSRNACVTGTVIFSEGDRNDRILTFDEANGETLWTAQTDIDIHASIECQDGVMYVSNYVFSFSDETTGETPGKIIAFNEKTGEKLWEYSSDKFHFHSFPYIAGGAVFLLIPNQYIALDARTGDQIWAFDRYLMNSPLVSENIIYFQLKDTISARELLTNNLLWEAKEEEKIITSDLAIFGDKLFVVRDHQIKAHDRKTGELLWSTEVEDKIEQAPVAAGDTIYLNTRDKVYSIDVTTGQTQWCYETEQAIEEYLPVNDAAVLAMTDNTISALGTGQGGVGPVDTDADMLHAEALTLLGKFESAKHMLEDILDRKPNLIEAHRALISVCDMADDAQCLSRTCPDFYLKYPWDAGIDHITNIWSKHTPLSWLFNFLDRPDEVSPWQTIFHGTQYRISPDIILILADQSYALAAKTGEPLWKFSPEDPGDFMLDITRSHDIAFVNTRNINATEENSKEQIIRGNLFALDVNTGRLLWRFSLTWNISEVIPASQGAIIVVADTIYSLDEKTGKHLWDIKINEDSKFSIMKNGWRVYKGMLLLAIEDWSNEEGIIKKFLRAVDPATGEKIWELEIQARYGTPRFWVFKDDNLYIMIGSSLFKIDLDTGKEIWRFNPGDEMLYRSGFLVTEHIVFFQTVIGLVDSFDASETGEEINIPDNDDIKCPGDTVCGKIFALDAKSGALLWRYTPEGIFLDNHVLLSGNVALIQQGDRDKFSTFSPYESVAIDTETGHELWSIGVKANPVYDAIFAGDKALLKYSDRVSVRDLYTSVRLWAFNPEADIISVFPVEDKGLVLLRADFFHKKPDLYALREDTGEIIWTYKQFPYSNIQYRNEKLLFSGNGVAVYDAETGGVKWKFEIDDQLSVLESESFDGNIYAAGSGNSLYAIDLEKAERMANSNARWWTDDNDEKQEFDGEQMPPYTPNEDVDTRLPFSLLWGLTHKALRELKKLDSVKSEFVLSQDESFLEFIGMSPISETDFAAAVDDMKTIVDLFTEIAKKFDLPDEIKLYIEQIDTEFLRYKTSCDELIALVAQGDISDIDSFASGENFSTPIFYMRENLAFLLNEIQTKMPVTSNSSVELESLEPGSDEIQYQDMIWVLTWAIANDAITRLEEFRICQNELLQDIYNDSKQCKSDYSTAFSSMEESFNLIHSFVVPNVFSSEEKSLFYNIDKEFQKYKSSADVLISKSDFSSTDYIEGVIEKADLNGILQGIEHLLERISMAFEPRITQMIEKIQ